MSDITVMIKRGEDGWRWSIDHQGDQSDGRAAYPTLVQAAQEAEQCIGQRWWAVKRHDTKARIANEHLLRGQQADVKSRWISWQCSKLLEEQEHCDNHRDNCRSQQP